ncbi:MAG: hypothetical protein ACRELF_01990 [Gemmataceae bacterium]
MKPVELIGHIDEQHRLHVELPPDVQPGPVKITVRPATEEDEEGDWLALINHSWAKDWSDPREDIYTLEDGKPSHERR